MVMPATSFGAKRAARMLVDRCQVERRSAAGWAVVEAVAPCAVADLRAQPAPGDPANAGLPVSHTWRVWFGLLTGVERGDRLTLTLAHDGTAPPPLIVGHVRAATIAVLDEVDATAEEVATEPVWITLYRWDQTTNTTATLGPYRVQAQADSAQPRDTGQTVSQTGSIVGGSDLDIAVGDRIGGIPWAFGALVIDVPAPIGDRREARFRYEVGQGG